MRVPFLDLESQHKDIDKAVARSLSRLFKRHDYVLGQDVREFETSFAAYVGARFAVGVNSGTDALFLGLLSLGVGLGDEVIVPAYTYIASAFAVTYTGARPVFVDIDTQTFNLNALLVDKAISPKTKAIMPVHLYGQSADMGALITLARRHHLKIIEDTAQAHGATYKGQRCGSMGEIGAFSFYPTKNLGAYGDAGMVLTQDEGLFKKVLKLRDYGRRTRYEHESLGYNSRLDAMQAVILKEKLKKLNAWNKKRQDVAELYRRLLGNIPGIVLPHEASYGKHVYHIFTVRVKNRDAVLEGLKQAHIQAAVHYPVPLHLQEVYEVLGYKRGDFPVAEAVAKDVLCLPIFPHMKIEQIKYVVKTLKGLIHG